jgi:hypothetical protein
MKNLSRAGEAAGARSSDPVGVAGPMNPLQRQHEACLHAASEDYRRRSAALAQIVLALTTPERLASPRLPCRW